MATHRAALVLTTINDPVALDDYFGNLSTFGHLEHVAVYVIPDRKTPPAAYARCAALRDRGLAVACPEEEEQLAFLRKVGFPPLLVPFDSDNRRNVGYLMALAEGADFVISIDDDNFSIESIDAVREHAVVRGELGETLVTTSSTGWFNACGLLELRPPATVYPRGFPYAVRHRAEALSTMAARVRIRVNAGLWLQAPDLDALTWLSLPVSADGFRGPSIVLATDTWSPINSQNTSFHRDVVASAYFIPMGFRIAGSTIDRYGDIFAGYFMEACVIHMGDSVRIGSPLAEHRRNSHVYLRDATAELPCVAMLEDLLPWLRAAKLQGSTYPEAYRSLSEGLDDAVEDFRGYVWTDESRAYFHRVAYCMRRWAQTCAMLN